MPICLLQQSCLILNVWLCDGECLHIADNSTHFTLQMSLTYVVLKDHRNTVCPPFCTLMKTFKIKTCLCFVSSHIWIRAFKPNITYFCSCSMQRCVTFRVFLLKYNLLFISALPITDFKITRKNTHEWNSEKLRDYCSLFLELCFILSKTKKALYLIMLPLGSTVGQNEPLLRCSTLLGPF